MPRIRRNILPQDIVMIIYLALLSSLIVTFRQNIPQWQSFLFFNLSVCLTVFGAYWYLVAPNGWQKFLRHLYPLLVFTFLYEEVGRLVLMIHPKYFDGLVNRLELAVFGNYPTIWLEKLYHPWTNELFMLGYVSYYFLMPTLAIALYLKNKIKQVDHVMLAISIGFYVSYITFLLIPVEGPHRNLVHLEGKELVGPIFTPFAKWLIDTYGIHGGCIPSSHVAVAFVTLLLAFRFYRKLGYILTPFVFALCVGTFWGRFHYFTDTVTGLLVAWIAVWVTDKFLGKYPVQPESLTSLSGLKK